MIGNLSSCGIGNIYHTDSASDQCIAPVIMVDARAHSSPKHELVDFYIDDSKLFIQIKHSEKQSSEKIKVHYEIDGNSEIPLVEFSIMIESVNKQKKQFVQLICVSLDDFEGMARAGGVQLKIQNFEKIRFYALPLH